MISPTTAMPDTAIHECLSGATTVASSPGHLRLSVPGLYRSPQRKSSIETALGGLAHVTEVVANPLTGRVLVLYDPGVAPPAMLSALGVAAANASSFAKVRLAASVTTPAAPRGADGRNGAGLSRPAPPAADKYPPWHLRPAQEALSHHGAARGRGLSSEVAAVRLGEGYNRLPQPPRRSSFALLASQFKSLPVGLLCASAVLSLATGGVAEAVSIAAVLALNGGIGFVTEKRAEETISALSELIDENSPVIRDGVPTMVPTSEIVRGDLLVLAPGVHVAADARVVDSHGMLVDESAFTGESHPVEKHSAILLRGDALTDRANMVYMGTAVAAGSGVAVVVGTGERTELGTIQAAMEAAEPPKTPIQTEMDSLGNRLVKISCAICVTVFGIGLLRGQGWLQMLKSSISLAIAAVPEGLPTVATTSLARGMRTMRARDMLIRRLQAVETIGAIHTICFDKTGTLTMNRMEAVAACAGMRELHLADGTLRSDGGGQAGESAGGVTRLMQVCVLSNETSASVGDPSSFLSSGSATENALVRLAQGSGVDVERLREAFPLVQAELRAEGRNYMRTVHAAPEGGVLVAVKGSPAEVMELCSMWQDGEDTHPIAENRREELMRANQEMAARQLRVLGFAYCLKPEPEDEERLVWLGLVGLADPLRPGADDVIRRLHRAGIRTTMITGDQLPTAGAVGNSLGLANDRDVQILDTTHLDDLSPAELDAMAEESDVFARVSPSRKLQIVQLLQHGGEVVAMTGDGINDGPALRASDVGIAMGRHGTDLARSAADVVLADDRLETVLDAIRQGRTITSNIEKSLHFLISSNLSEILVVLGAVTATGASPLTPMQLLWINLLSDVLPAVALATEPADPDVMDKPPRDPKKPLVSNADLKRYGVEGGALAGGALAAFAYGSMRYGDTARAGSLAFNALVLGQLLHAYGCRSRTRTDPASGKRPRNGMLDLAVGGSLALQVVANLIPGLRGLLGLSPTGLGDFGVILAAAGIPLLINGATKPNGPATPP